MILQAELIFKGYHSLVLVLSQFFRDGMVILGRGVPVLHAKQSLGGPRSTVCMLKVLNILINFDRSCSVGQNNPIFD